MTNPADPITQVLTDARQESMSDYGLKLESPLLQIRISIQGNVLQPAVCTFDVGVYRLPNKSQS